jgi:hypothetical protein
VAAGRFTVNGAPVYNFGGLTANLTQVAGVNGRIQLLQFPNFRGSDRYIVKAMVIVQPVAGGTVNVVFPALANVLEVPVPASNGILLYLVNATNAEPPRGDVMVEITRLP